MSHDVLTYHCRLRTDKGIAKSEAKAVRAAKAVQQSAKNRHAAQGMTVSEAIQDTDNKISQSRRRYDKLARDLQKEADTLEKLENNLAAFKMEQADEHAKAEEAADAADAEEVSLILKA